MELRSLGLLSFGAAALAWLLFGGLLVLRRDAGPIGRLFLAAVLTQALWALTLALAIVPFPPAAGLTGLVEALRTLLWIILLLQLLVSGDRPLARDNDLFERWHRRGLVLAATLAAASAAVDYLHAGSQAPYVAKTLLTVTCLVCLEQVYRSTHVESRWRLKFLAIALGAIFALDLFVYSEALLFSRLNPSLWITRGFANALLVPLVAIAAARNRHWKLDIGVSRSAVFHSATLFAAGAYLLLFAAGGYYIRYFGGEWGEVAQALVLFGATVGLAALSMSETMRARLRVFLSKHFFSYRFDYRDQWLRLTRALTNDDPQAPSQSLPRRVLWALGRAVESPGGALWLREDGEYRCIEHYAYRGPRLTIPAGAPLPVFLAEREWIIELDEWRNHRERYDGLALPSQMQAHESGWLIAPLLLESELIGFVLLERPVAPLSLDWEVRDLLKTAARQAASYIGVQRAVERLVQAQQFESFNRMSAFVVHDLKNLVAQLSLMTRNAHRHRDNPEFQVDMLATVENVIERMQGLLLQLRVGVRPVEKPAPVRLVEALRCAVESRRHLQPVPSLDIEPPLEGRSILAHRDRFERLIGHLVQNAADAIDSASGAIRVSAREDGTHVLIEVQDDGRGMNEDFVRERLFKPFESTKRHGMGIGTFESREYVCELGGSIEVDSREGYGTTFRIRLPLTSEHVPVPIAVMQITGD